MGGERPRGFRGPLQKAADEQARILEARVAAERLWLAKEKVEAEAEAARAEAEARAAEQQRQADLLAAEVEAARQLRVQQNTAFEEVRRGGFARKNAVSSCASPSALRHKGFRKACGALESWPWSLTNPAVRRGLVWGVDALVCEPA